MDNEKENDITDAGGISRQPKPKCVETSLPGTLDDEEYFMKFPKRGKCLIFNHKGFASHLDWKPRNGTEVDSFLLYNRFKDLGFHPEFCDDLTVREVKEKLEEAGKEDHAENSCFVCCILSHGDNGILCAHDGSYPIEDLFAPFRGDVCPSLVGKPKLFFIQACQGKKPDDGSPVVCRESTDSLMRFKIPLCADFLVAISTVPGFLAWKNSKTGSWFIQALSDVLDHHGKDKDLLDILTIVNRKVALSFQSNVPDEPKMHRKKQVPLISSTLTRKVWFRDQDLTHFNISCSIEKKGRPE